MEVCFQLEHEKLCITSTFFQILYVLAYSMYTKGFFSQRVFTNLSKSVLGSPPLLRLSLHLTDVAYQDADQTP